MPAHQLANQEISIGLKWLNPNAISAKASTAKLEKVLRQNQSNPVAFTLIHTRYGTQLGISTDFQDIGKTSGAAWLAAGQSSAILVERLHDEKFWLCAVEDSTVFPAGDLIGNKDKINNRLVELQSDTAGSEIPFYDKFGDFDLPDSQALDFAQLVSGIEPPIESSCQAVRVRRNRKSIIFASALTLAGCLGAGSWIFLQTNPGNNQVSVSQSENEALLAYRETEKQKILETLSQDSGALVALLVDLINDRPLYVNGWKLESYQWKSGKIVATWQREQGKIAGISEHLDGTDWYFNELNGTVVEQIPFPAPKHTKPFAFKTDSSNLDRRYQFLDILAKTPGTWTINAAKKLGKNYPIKRSEINSSGEGLNSAYYIVGMLRENPVLLNEFIVNLNLKIQWSLAGEYYEKDA